MTSPITAKPPEPPMLSNKDNLTAPSTDFAKLLNESSLARQAESEKESKALGNGNELQLGETKNDAEFRGMLEKITGKKQDKLKNKLEKDDYLNLMVTQLKYQDPTKPMEQQEMATQLAQFNTVEQIMNTNKLLGEIKTGQSQGNVDNLSKYVGKTVEVSGLQVHKKADSVSTVNFELPMEVGSVSAQILTEDGKAVRQLSLGKKSVGKHELSWDGKDDLGKSLSDGKYKVEITAMSMDGKPVAAKGSFNTLVTGAIDLDKGGKLETKNGVIELSQIVALREDRKETPTPLTAANTNAHLDSSKKENDTKLPGKQNNKAA